MFYAITILRKIGGGGEASLPLHLVLDPLLQPSLKHLASPPWQGHQVPRAASCIQPLPCAARRPLSGQVWSRPAAAHAACYAASRLPPGPPQLVVEIGRLLCCYHSPGITSHCRACQFLSKTSKHAGCDFLLCLWVDWSTTKNFSMIAQFLHGLNLGLNLQ